jgi:ankyrin repeat protein
VFCQLETLRRAVQPNVRRILEKLPKTLDETYERVLKNINDNNRDHARHLLHCLAVSVRPLRVEELAEILCFDFDVPEGSISKFHPDRRPNNQEDAILSICSGLITMVDNRRSRVVQFSHLSVKEFLTSSHLASTVHLASYRILPVRAHTILAQVCLGLLLHPNDRNRDKSVRVSSLSEYAAQHWVTHVQFEGVSPRVLDGMKILFDADKPHFSAWIGLFDIDGESGGKSTPEIPSPLYYSALCGFHDLIRHIANKYPQHVNAIGGSYGFPLVAALCRNHFQVAELLLENGGRVDVRDTRKQTALHKTIGRNDCEAIEAVQFLLKYGADVNAQRDDLWTPLHLALSLGKLKVARLLLDHQADVHARNNDGQAPLHLLSRLEAPENVDDGSDIAKLLLKCGANVNEKDKDDATPLHVASYYKRLEIVRVLLDNGASLDMETDQGKTPLQIVIRSNGDDQGDGVDIARLLVEHGAEVYARDNYRLSTSDLACCFGKEKIALALFGDRHLFKHENSLDETFRRWIEGEYYSQEHSLVVSHVVPRVRRGWQPV